ncbi:hypothetical protein BDV93DRAFT_566272 [Ceratobasidium sp. AG-I]|nr:hypothetical protein BDV93DRAFT_566272 [Ceratobasidium sp. AG-I]
MHQQAWGRASGIGKQEQQDERETRREEKGKLEEFQALGKIPKPPGLLSTRRTGSGSSSARTAQPGRKRFRKPLNSVSLVLTNTHSDNSLNTNGYQVFGWAAGLTPVSAPSNPSSRIVEHEDFALWTHDTASAHFSNHNDVLDGSV